MAEHPSKEELSGFLLGQLTSDTCEVVAEHVEQCPPCQQTIHDLEAMGDTLVEMLRKPAVTDDDRSKQVIERVVAVVENTRDGVSQTQDIAAPQEDAPTNFTQAKLNIPPREAFERALKASGAIDDEEWNHLRQQIPEISTARDAAELAKLLVQHGALTKFQASLLYQGKSGLRMGEYIVLDQIGAGGMGQVFKARHRRMDRVVAIKVLAKSAMNSPEAVKRFQREVKAAAKLSHPNIVTAYDAGEQDGVHFLVMEYVEGHDLSSVIKQHGPLPLERVMAYLTQAARGLAFAHSKGVVHRDIKPANLLLDPDGTVKILDMGLARMDGEKANLAALDGLTQSGQVMGTVDYMAPEQAFDTRTADAKADVYSLGCTAHRLLTGRNAYDGETLVQKILAHREQPIPTLSSPHGVVTLGFDGLYRRMMAKKPEDRPTMSEVVTELEALQKAASAGRAEADSAPHIVVAPQKAATGGRATRPVAGSNRGRRPPIKYLAAAAGAAALLFFGVWIIIRDKDGKTVAEIDATPGTRVKVPAGGSVEVAGDNAPGSAPTVPVTAPSSVSSRPVSVADTAGPATGDYALFAYEVRTDMPIDPSQPQTFEAYVTPFADRDIAHWALVGRTGRSGISLQCGVHWSLTLFDEEKKNIQLNSDILPVVGRRTHVAAVYTPKLMRLYIDGVLMGTKELGDFTTSTKPWTFSIGVKIDDQIDEIRVSKSVRYDQNFTPQARFTTDADTLGLYHCDEGAGTVLHDSSGNGYDGKIISPKWVRADGSAIASATAAEYALSFDDKSVVEIPSLKLGPAAPLTLEGYVTPRELPQFFRHLIGVEGQFDLQITQGGTWGVSIAPTKDQTGYPLSGATPATVGHRLHIAAVYNGADLRLYLDGKHARLLKTDGRELPPSSKNFALGGKFIGEMDEIRVSKSARYSNPFTPPVRFEPDADTTALYHFDEGTGDVLKDSSGNNHHGKIVGAKWVRADGSAIPSLNVVTVPSKSPGREPGDNVAGQTTPAPWNTPAFQQWVNATQALPAKDQIEAVRQKLMELNPGFDGRVSNTLGTAAPDIEKGVVVTLMLETDKIIDLSPLHALSGLKELDIKAGLAKSKLSDLSPLRGLKLRVLICTNTAVQDLTPLTGMPLYRLHCGGTRVVDLTPLAGMPLEYLLCYATPVTNLSPLSGKPLAEVDFRITGVTDLTPLHLCKKLKKAALAASKVTSAEVAALQTALPNCKIDWEGSTKSPGRAPGDNLAGQTTPARWNTPEFQQWVKATQKLPAEQQLEAVSKKLMELNPGFDGKFTGYSTAVATNSPKVENGVVVELGFITDKVENLAPLRALPGLRRLLCAGNIPRKGQLVDLSPLAGLPLTNLDCAETQVADLSPLAGMPLKALTCNDTQVNDLSPLVGIPLTDLRIFRTAVSDLTPLQGMKLGLLYCNNTPVSDVSPLAGMPLKTLNCSDTQVGDLTPLKGMQLPSLWFHDTLVSDVTPLEGMPLKSLRFTPANITRGIDTLRAMTTLVDLGLKHATSGSDVYKPAEFWKKYDTGEFAKSTETKKLAYLGPNFQQWVETTQKLSAEKQLEAVSKKLMELNPGFDGKLGNAGSVDGRVLGEPRIVDGAVTEIGFNISHVTDLSPLRALTRLVKLTGSAPESARSQLSDLAPLEKLQLQELRLEHAALGDLNPLQRMPLEKLSCVRCGLSDLSPLAGLPLRYLALPSNQDLKDLSPLKAMPLEYLALSYTNITDVSSLRDCPLKVFVAYNNAQLADVSLLSKIKTLTDINVRGTKVTSDQVTALQKALPNCKIDWDDPTKSPGRQPGDGIGNLTTPARWNTPAFQQWVETTQKLSAEKQLEAVSKKLMELNPGFDGKLTGIELKPDPKIENGVVTEVGFLTIEVTDISPVRAFPGLKALACSGQSPRKGKLVDISPVTGINLVYFSCSTTQVTDLTPLSGMSLTRLSCQASQVSDLSVVAGMPITHLNIGQTKIADLGPLRGMRLSSFNGGGAGTKVQDLSVLSDMPLEFVHGVSRAVTDFSPLESCQKLRVLDLRGSQATPADIAKLQQALPNCKIERDDPVQKSPAEKKP